MMPSWDFLTRRHQKIPFCKGGAAYGGPQRAALKVCEHSLMKGKHLLSMMSRSEGGPFCFLTEAVHKPFGMQGVSNFIFMQK